MQYFLKITVSPPISLEKSLNIGKVIKLMVNLSFPKFSFLLESSIFIIGNKYCQFPSSIFKKITAKFLSLNNCGLLVILSNKDEKRWLGQLASRIILEMLFPQDTCFLISSRSALCRLLISSWRILKGCILIGQDLIQLILFTGSSRFFEVLNCN